MWAPFFGKAVQYPFQARKTVKGYDLVSTSSQSSGKPVAHGFHFSRPLVGIAVYARRPALDSVARLNHRWPRDNSPGRLGVARSAGCDPKVIPVRRTDWGLGNRLDHILGPGDF